MSGYTQAELNAINRLGQYNSGVWSSPGNTSGMAGDGYKYNLTVSYNDAALVANGVARVTGDASTSATSAEQWASQLGTEVANVDFSAKEWAVGVAAQSAKSWATSVALVDGVNYGAKKYALDANTSANNAATSEVNSQTAASDAQGYASQALAAAASIGYKDVVFLSAANSPVTVDQTYSGKLLDINTGAGNVVVNLPQVSALSLPFVVGVKKSSADTNTVTVNRAGTDTFDDGATSICLTGVQGSTLIPDMDPSPHQWARVDFGSQVLAKATTAEAQAGVEDTHYMTAAKTKDAIAALSSQAPVGSILQSKTSPGASWLPCDGSIYTQASKAALFAAIGLLPDNPITSRWSPSVSPFAAYNNIVPLVAFGNGVFVAAGYNGYSKPPIATSSDGKNWVTRNPLAGTTNGQQISSLAFLNGQFVIATNSKIYTSADGVTWALKTSSGNSFVSMAYGAGVYVGVMSNDVAYTSTDLITWANTGNAPADVILFANNKFIGCKVNSQPAYSTDGTNWTYATGSSGNGLAGLLWDGTHFVGFDRSNNAPYRSSDGVTWAAYGVQAQAGTPVGAAFAGGKYILVLNGSTNGSVICVSTTLISWSQYFQDTTNANDKLGGVATDGTNWLVAYVGDNSPYYGSGVIYSNNPQSNQWYFNFIGCSFYANGVPKTAVRVGAKLFVPVGYVGQQHYYALLAFTSTTVESYFIADQPAGATAPGYFTSYHYFDGTHVVLLDNTGSGGAGPASLRSTDLVNWTKSAITGPASGTVLCALRCTGYDPVTPSNPNKWWCAGNDGYLYYSTDLAAWTAASVSTTNTNVNWTSAVIGCNVMFVCTGVGSVYSTGASSSSTTYNSVGIPSGANTLAAVGELAYVTYGSPTNSVSTSADGTNWIAGGTGVSNQGNYPFGHDNVAVIGTTITTSGGANWSQWGPGIDGSSNPAVAGMLDESSGLMLFDDGGGANLTVYTPQQYSYNTSTEFRVPNIPANDSMPVWIKAS